MQDGVGLDSTPGPATGALRESDSILVQYPPQWRGGAPGAENDIVILIAYAAHDPRRDGLLTTGGLCQLG